MVSPTKKTWNKREARDAKLLKRRQARIRLANAKKREANQQQNA